MHWWYVIAKFGRDSKEGSLLTGKVNAFLNTLQICDTTAELAAGTSDTSPWPELLPFIFQLVQAQDVAEIESALLVFAQLAHYIMPTLTQYMGTLNSILQQCLGSTNVDVALAAMRATTAFIQELEENQDRDKFQVAISDHQLSPHCTFLIKAGGSEARRLGCCHVGNVASSLVQ